MRRPSLHDPARRTPARLCAAPLALVLSLAACDEASVDLGGPATVATVRVRASAPRVAPDDTVALSAELLDARGRTVAGAPVTWQWSDSTVLERASEGTPEGGTLRVRALRAAVVQVIAQSGDVRGVLEMTVRYADVKSVRFNFPTPDSVSVVVGSQPTVGAVAVDSLGRIVRDQFPVVTSSDTTVATVGSTSVGPRLFTRNPGRTEVVATLGSLRASMVVRVLPAPRYVFPDTSVLIPGLTRTLRAQELPVDQQARAVVADGWLSSAPEVATVSATGVVTAASAGRATIAAIVGTDTLRALVVVKPTTAPVEYVALVQSAPCAIARDGGIYCWGSDAQNQLGTSEVVDRCETFQPFSGAGRMWWVRTVHRCSALPVRVQSASRFVSGSGTGPGVCALTDSGSVECWGVVPTAARTSPVPVPVAPGLRVASVDGRCLLTTDGEVHCWGDWTVPIFEDGTRTSQTPQRVPTPAPFRQLSTGSVHLCGVTTADVVHCWGSNLTGEIGVTGSVQAPGCFVACEPRPRQVPGLPATRVVQVGSSSSCALDPQGVARCWGAAYANGRSAPSPTPALVPNAPAFTTLANAGSAYCGLTAEGGVWCWGSGFNRPDGSAVFSVERAERAAPSFPLRAHAMASGSGCGIGTDAVLSCWGHGLLGDGDMRTNNAPWRLVKVAGQR